MTCWQGAPRQRSASRRERGDNGAIERRRATFFSRPAATADWPLERVIAELCERPNVQGLLAIGSTGRNERSEVSDIDLVVR